MDGTELHAIEQRWHESEARTMASYSEPDSCHWRISGPSPEISNTPEYQELNSQAMRLQIALSSWGECISDLLVAQRRVKEAGYLEEQTSLAVGIAHGMNPAIATAVARHEGIKVELARVRAELTELSRRAL